MTPTQLAPTSSSRSAILLALLLLAPRVACAEDWPWLRGPRHDGTSTETGILDSWPNDGPPVLWSRDLGQGYSSFAVVNGRAYTQYQGISGQFVICLDGSTGETVWEHRYALPFEPFGIYPGPRSTPTVADGRVYFADPDGLVGCLAASDGEKVWSVNLITKYNGRGTEFGYASSPLLMDGLLFLPIGGQGASIVALDPATGEVVWSTGDDSASYSTILPIMLDGERLLVAYLENAIVVCEPETGRIVWRESLSHGYDEHSAQPLYEEPLLLLAAPFRAGANVYHLSWDRDVDPPRLHGRHHWNSSEFSNDVVSSLSSGGTIWGFDLRDPQSKAHRPSRGTFRCLDFASGDELWSTPELGQSCMIAADGKVILFTDAGEVVLLRQSREEYQELARISLCADEVCWTPPALSDGRLYLRTHERALCLHLGDESEMQPAELARAVPAADVAAMPSTGWDLLLNGEREHPFMRPAPDELRQWYFGALAGAFGPAFVLTLTWRLFRRPRGLESMSTPGTPPGGESSATLAATPAVYLACLLVFGIAATPALNEHVTGFTFTWPAALYAGLQLTLLIIVWAEQQTQRRSTRRRSRLAGLLFLALCAAYFLALRAASLPHEWIFLVGLLPAFPCAAWAARRMQRWRRLLPACALSLVSFSVYFWICGLFQIARTVWGF